MTSEKLRIWLLIPENRARYNEQFRRRRAANPEKYRAMRTKLRRKKGILSNKEAFKIKRKHILHDPKAQEKSWQTTKAKKELHPKALFWSLISPCGQVFKFRNLNAFVECNQHLFTSDQLEYVRQTKGRPKARIAKSLCKLSPRRKHPGETVHGWRWHIDGKDHETLLTVLPAPSE